jgi:electron transfer flavoprotein alpha subunit
VNVMVVAEHVRGTLSSTTMELVTAARELGGFVALAVIAKDPASLDVRSADVDEVVHVPVDSEEFESDVHCSALEALITDRRPRLTLLGFTVNSMSYASALAAKLGIGFASDVHGLKNSGDQIVATRSFYGSKVEAEIAFPGNDQIVLLLRPTVWPVSETHGSPMVSIYRAPSVVSRARHRAYIEPPAGDVDITQADFLLSIGRGIGDAESIEGVAALAEKMGASLSASRPLIDAGWVSAARQVGQSGKSVTPKVYLALGISGAVQHLAGMRSSGTIIAVNTDPDAAIFSVAHYGAVANLFDVAAELDKLY